MIHIFMQFIYTVIIAATDVRAVVWLGCGRVVFCFSLHANIAVKLFFIYTDFSWANSKTAQAILVLQCHILIIYLYYLT